MLQVVPKWMVTVTLSSGKNHQVWISDTFAENVLRKVADMSFSPNPTVFTERIVVEIMRPTVPDIQATAGTYERTRMESQ